MQARFYLPMWGRFASPDPGSDQHFEDTQSWNIYSYVQNNPVMHFDPDGMELRPASKDPAAIKAFNSAIAYLKKSPIYAKAIATVDASSSVTLVHVLPGSRRGQQQGNSIAWDPNNGSRVVDDNKKPIGGIRTPANILGHELGHKAEMLEHPAEYFKNDATTKGAGSYHDMEEMRNIQDFESPAAKELGEPTRKNHLGESVTVKGPTSQVPQKRVAPVKKKEEKK